MQPPLIMHAYKRIPMHIVRDMPPDWGLGVSDNGWMTGESFFEYIANVFYKWIRQNNIVMPIVLFVDGHKSHMTYNLSKFCSDHEIILVALYPNSTHLLQPLDVAVFKPLKVAWKKTTRDWRALNFCRKIEKKEFATLLKKAIESFDLVLCTKSGFKACGLFPFNADAIAYHRLLKIDQLPENTVVPTIVNSVAVDNTAIEKLKVFESLIDAETLIQFKECRQSWSGDIEMAAMFKVIFYYFYFLFIFCYLLFSLDVEKAFC